jgi:hypothetical protein
MRFLPFGFLALLAVLYAIAVNAPLWVWITLGATFVLALVGVIRFAFRLGWKRRKK